MSLVVIVVLGIAFLTAATVISLVVLRVVTRYHVEEEGIRVTFLAFTLWYARWSDIRSVRIVSSWQALRPSFTVRLGTRPFGPGVEIRKRYGGAILTPDDPEQFAREVKQKAMLQ